MSGDKTSFEVETKLTVTDHASASLEKIEHHAEHAAHAVEEMKEGLKMAAEAIGLRELIMKTGEVFIGFNSAVEQTKIKLSTMIGSDFQVSWKRASDVAGEMYEKFEKFESLAPVDAKEMAAFAQTVSTSVFAAGGNIENLTKIAEEGSVAAKALGFDAQRGAMELNRMLSGQVGNRSQMAKMLLGSMGLDAAAWKKLKEPERLEKLEGALGSGTMKSAAESMKGSFQGSMAMFKNTLEQTAGAVGLPLFKAITKEVVSWNKWIEANPEKIAEITGKLTNGIKEVMSMMRDIGSFLMPIIKEAMSAIGTVMTFVSEHRSVIEGVVKGLLIYKGIGMAGVAGGAAHGGMGAIGGLVKELGTSLSALKTGLSGIGGATSLGGMLTSFGGALGGLIGAAGPIALFGTALFGLAKVMFGETQTEKESRERAEGLKKVSDKWLEDRKEREALLLDRAKYGDNWHGTGARLKELEHVGDRESVIKAGIESGYIKEEISNGLRRLSITGGFNQGLSRDNPKLIGDLADDINQIFKEAASRSVSEWGHESAVFQPRGPSRGTVGSYLEEKLDELAEPKEEDLKSKVPVNQTVNITINQVSAKDPDRWLADIDDMAGRSLNAPRRTKSSLATRAGRGH